MSGSDREITIKLTSNDDQSFVVNYSVIRVSEFVKSAIDIEDNEDDLNDRELELTIPNLRSKMLAKIIEFSILYSENPMSHIPKVKQNKKYTRVLGNWESKKVELF